jgi:hypothetical protein
MSSTGRAALPPQRLLSNALSSRRFHELASGLFLRTGAGDAPPSRLLNDGVIHRQPKALLERVEIDVLAVAPL